MNLKTWSVNTTAAKVIKPKSPLTAETMAWMYLLLRAKRK